MILALVNNKGGVAKTTTAVNLAAGMAIRGYRVLLCDLDSQGSASLSIGISRSDIEPSAANVILAGEPIRGAIRETHIEGVELLAGSIGLVNADVLLPGMPDGEKRLSNALRSVHKRYDFMLLDCPPSLGMTTINALVAADKFLVPVTPDYLAFEGLLNLTAAVERMRNIRTVAGLAGLILTRVDYRTRAARDTVDLLRKHYEGQVLKTEIRINVRLAEAPSHGQTIFEYDERSSGAQSYKRLTAEIVRRCKMMNSGIPVSIKT